MSDSATTQAIESVQISSRHLSQWGVKFCEYDYVDPTSGATEECLDLERLTIRVSNRRAAVIEDEVQPMAVRMERRNTELDWLGQALADLSAFSADFTTQADGTLKTDSTHPITENGMKGLKLIGRGLGTAGEYTLQKYQVDAWTQEIKTAMDSRNNKSSQDMTRLQSLVDRRDEAYSTSSSLSDKLAGTRSTTIKNMV